MKLLKESIAEKIEAALDRLDSRHKAHADRKMRPKARLEYARDEKFGDYACTAAMDKRLRGLFAKVEPSFQNPRNFAEAIAGELSSESPEVFASVEIAGPGFINLRLSEKLLLQCLDEARNQGPGYGRFDAGRPKKILFEFVSANPTGPLNVVSARAAALGDSACNLLEAAGHLVDREYYVNDHGNQVKLLGQSSLLRFLELKGISVKFANLADGSTIYPKGPGLPFPSGGYHGDYLIEKIKELIDENSEALPDEKTVEKFKELAQSEELTDAFLDKPEYQTITTALGEAVLLAFVEEQKEDLENFRVEFDAFFRESRLHKSGAVLGIRKKLQSYIKEEGKKEFFLSTRFGDDKDRVIVREDGRPTYLLADIAYHADKIERGYDEIVNIWGPDHHGYIARLAGAMEALGFPREKFRVLIAQQVNLLDKGEPIKMSKRAGKVITMRELLKEIPVDVARYFFVMRSFEAHLDFDLAMAKDTSDTNPYYYVAYAYARIQSIFRVLKEERGLNLPRPTRLKHSQSSPLPAIEWTQERRALLWLVARFPEEIAAAAAGPDPHYLVSYLYNLASAFSSFYNRKENRIKEMDDKSAQSLLALLDGVALVLKNGLRLLGMEAPDRM